MNDDSARKRAPQNRLLFWFAAALIPEAAAYQIESPRAMAQRAERLRHHLHASDPGREVSARGDGTKARGDDTKARGDDTKARGDGTKARGETRACGEADGRAAA